MTSGCAEGITIFVLLQGGGDEFGEFLVHILGFDIDTAVIYVYMTMVELRKDKRDQREMKEESTSEAHINKCTKYTQC